MVLHLLNFGSTEKSKLHVLCFQSSAARSQPGAAQFVQPLTPMFAKLVSIAVFRGFPQGFGLIITLKVEFPFVKIAHNPCWYCHVREDELGCGINELICHSFSMGQIFFLKRKFFEIGCSNTARRAWIAILLLALGTGCEVQRRKSDAELGLTPRQAAGRHIYDQYCDRCHLPYSSKKRQGPSLKGLFKREDLPVSGMPANDDRVKDVIRMGRNKMDGFGNVLTDEQISDLLAYLHTL
jgi:mono/diheme cytochrome c family protein